MLCATEQCTVNEPQRPSQDETCRHSQLQAFKDGVRRSHRTLQHFLCKLIDLALKLLQVCTGTASAWLAESMAEQLRGDQTSTTT